MNTQWHVLYVFIGGACRSSVLACALHLAKWVSWGGKGNWLEKPSVNAVVELENMWYLYTLSCTIVETIDACICMIIEVQKKSMNQHTHIYKCTRTHVYTDRLEIYVSMGYSWDFRYRDYLGIERTTYIFNFPLVFLRVMFGWKRIWVIFSLL